jgi:hypothetical protein
MQVLTKEQLKEKLLKDKNVLIKALIALNNYQTSDEQQALTTKYLNGAGFRPCHANRGTGMVNFFQTRGFLSEKQINWWTQTRREDSKPRILIYLNQLYRIHLKRYEKHLTEKGIKNEKSKI